MNHLVFALTAPADPAVFERIRAAHANFEAWTAALREKKIDVQHEVAVKARLDKDEALMARYQDLEAGTNGGIRIHDEFHHSLRALRIYFRVLLLDLLNQEDAWQAQQDAKASTKGARPCVN